MSLVRRAHEGAVADLILDRPDVRNALSAEMCDEIVTTLDDIVTEGSARAILVRGEGQSFCAGADFAAVSGPDGIGFLPLFERMLEALARVPLPTVASIQGAALGGGFQLASVCDLRIAETEAKIGIPASRFGILVNFENIQRLVLLVGTSIAKEVLLTGRTYSGAEAAVKGLVHEAIPSDELETRGRALAQDLASKAPLSVRGAKAAIQTVTDHLARARITDEGSAAAIDELVMQAYHSADLAEGLAAMSEKRTPRFEGH